jgi:O-antigen ligase
LVFFYSRRLFLVLLICAGTYYVTQKAFVSSTLDEESTVSGETRLGAWDQVLTLTSRHYLFGTGPAGYQFYFSTYQGYMYQLSHNNYIDILAQTGVYGFSMFILFWLSTTFMAIKLFFALPKKNDFIHALGLTLIAFNAAIYVTMMLGDWITPFTYTQGLAGIDYDIWPWMMTGLTVALYYEIQKQKAEAPQTALVVQSGDSSIVSQPLTQN